MKGLIDKILELINLYFELLKIKKFVIEVLGFLGFLFLRLKVLEKKLDLARSRERGVSRRLTARRVKRLEVL